MERRRSQGTPVERRIGPVSREGEGLLGRQVADALGTLAEDRLAGEQFVVLVSAGQDGVADDGDVVSHPSGRSAAVPPGRMKLWFIRSPVVFSKKARIISRSRKP